MTPVVLHSASRSGVVSQALHGDALSTAVRLVITPDARFVASLRRQVGLRWHIDQSDDDGVTWYSLGGGAANDVGWLMRQPLRNGQLRDAITSRFTEQVYRDDIRDRYGWTTRREVPTDQRQTYYQLALCKTLRVTIASAYYDGDVPLEDAELRYGVTLALNDQLPMPVLLGRHSASLLGIFTGAHGGTATVVTSSRTTTAGTLVTACGAHWKGSAGVNVSITSNLAGTYTPIPAGGEVEFGAFVGIGMAHNIGGTRGAGHTITSSAASSTSSSVTAQEWDGIEASPTVASNTATGSSSAPSASVAVSASSLVVLGFAYDGGASTIAVNDGAQASEEDETNTNQAQAVHYKVAQTGTPSITGTLGASRAWGAIIVTFTEAAGGGGATPAALSTLTLMGVQ